MRARDDKSAARRSYRPEGRISDLLSFAAKRNAQPRLPAKFPAQKYDRDKTVAMLG
jgi:hypothetical protein